jgi:hypothetical protein
MALLDLVGPSPQQRLRSIVLRALQELSCPLSPRQELRPYVATLHEQDVTQEEFEAPLRAERQAFVGGEQRPVWLCAGIGPNQRGLPDRWARSDWDLSRRVVHPQSEPARRAWLLRQLHGLLPVDQAGEVAASPLTELYQRHARLLPQRAVERVRQRFRRHDPDYTWAQHRFDSWQIVAEGLFDELAAADQRRCEEVAEQLADRDLKTQLFGID